jgi:hypothetical protein
METILEKEGVYVGMECYPPIRNLNYSPKITEGFKKYNEQKTPLREYHFNGKLNTLNIFSCKVVEIYKNLAFIKYSKWLDEDGKRKIYNFYSISSLDEIKKADKNLLSIYELNRVLGRKTEE